MGAVEHEISHTRWRWKEWDLYFSIDICVNVIAMATARIWTRCANPTFHADSLNTTHRALPLHTYFRACVCVFDSNLKTGNKTTFNAIHFLFYPLEYPQKISSFYHPPTRLGRWKIIKWRKHQIFWQGFLGAMIKEIAFSSKASLVPDSVCKSLQESDKENVFVSHCI